MDELQILLSETETYKLNSEKQQLITLSGKNRRDDLKILLSGIETHKLNSAEKEEITRSEKST
jgi:predicted NAD/FAD-binding protein